MEKSTKEIALEIFSEVKREGIEKLLEWVEKSDYFTAPASTRFHGSYKGGLVQHHLNVFHRLEKEINIEYGDIESSPYSRETLILVAMCHDLCKVDYYKETTRNVKNEKTGNWEKVPYYTVEDKLPMLHGPKSQYILSSFIKLNRDESLAIMSHMGGFDSSCKGGDYTISAAFGKSKLAFLLHIADMKATYLDESGSN